MTPDQIKTVSEVGVLGNVLVELLQWIILHGWAPSSVVEEDKVNTWLKLDDDLARFFKEP